jgi:hypothetical protein
MTSENYADALDAAATAKLARALRAVFPHDGLPEAPYLRSAEAIVANVSGSTHQLGVVVEGIRSLEALAGGDLVAVGTDLLSGILRHLEQTEFFQIMLTSAVVTLYSDHEVWDYLGYEGFSSEQGGYISRGFDDLSWLPEPRILEYVGDEQLVEYVPAVPGVQISFDNTKKVATI